MNPTTSDFSIELPCLQCAAPPLIYAARRPSRPDIYSMYLPVQQGDTLQERYTIVRELGKGLYSQVWLVYDDLMDVDVALKILTLGSTKDQNALDERGILTRISNTTKDGQNNVVQLWDCFDHQGPEGVHACFVLELLGPTLLDVKRQLSANEQIPLRLLKHITKDLLKGLAFLHDSCGIIHTDLKHDNIMVEYSDFDISHPGSTLHDPRLRSLTYKIADLGHANFVDNQVSQHIQPNSFRAPEVILRAPWGTAVDIFNLGCLIYELATSCTLFTPFEDNEEYNLAPDELHLTQMLLFLGPFPKDFLKECELRDRFFDEQGHIKSATALRSPSFYEILFIELGNNYEEKEALLFYAFLLCCLVLDPKSRASASALLTHPWLSSASAM